MVPLARHTPTRAFSAPVISNYQRNVSTVGVRSFNTTHKEDPTESAMHKKGREAADATMAAAKKGGEFVSGAAAKAYASTKEAVSNMTHSSESEMHKKGGEAVDAAKAAATSAKETVVDTATSAMNKGKEAGTQAVNSAKEYAKSTAESAKEFVNGAKDAAKDSSK